MTQGLVEIHTCAAKNKRESELRDSRRSAVFLFSSLSSCQECVALIVEHFVSYFSCVAVAQSVLVNDSVHLYSFSYPVSLCVQT